MTGVFLKIQAFFLAALTALLSIIGVKVERTLDKEKLSKNIDSFVSEYLSDGKMTGCEILVNQHGERVFDGLFGKKNAAGDTLKKGAIYRIASMTKPVTAAALLIEHERGHLSIYDDVSKYLDGFENMYVGKVVDGKAVADKKAENSIKVYQLVSHSSGISDTTELGGILFAQAVKDNPTIQSVTEFMSDKPLSYDPGTSQSYSTIAFDIAARIIEITSGLPFDEYLRVNIFDKLGMNNTAFEPTEEQWSELVTIHARDEDGKIYDAPTAPGCIFGGVPVTYHMAGAGLVSNAEDYMKFAQMLLNDGTGENGERIMSSESVKLMRTPFVSKDIMPGGEQWGLGVRVITDNNRVLPKGSFGWSGAYGTHFWMDPTNDVTVVLMKNSSYDGGSGAAASARLEEEVMRSFDPCLKFKKAND